MQRLFSRVNNIQSMNKDEKTEKIKDFQNIVLELEQRIFSAKKDKTEKIAFFQETIDGLKQALEKETEVRDKNAAQIRAEIQKLDENCREVTQEISSRRDETDQNLVRKLNQSIELLQQEISQILLCTDSQE